MLDLNASDRQMALNEVKVLAKMDHPNIVAYHDSFEKGTLYSMTIHGLLNRWTDIFILPRPI